MVVPWQEAIADVASGTGLAQTTSGIDGNALGLPCHLRMLGRGEEAPAGVLGLVAEFLLNPD